MAEKYLDLDELVFHLITFKKYKRDIQFWLSHLNELVDGKKEMKETRPSIQFVIKHYLSDLKDFSESLMKVLINLQELTRYNKQYKFETYC